MTLSLNVQKICLTTTMFYQFVLSYDLQSIVSVAKWDSKHAIYVEKSIDNQTFFDWILYLCKKKWSKIVNVFDAGSKKQNVYI